LHGVFLSDDDIDYHDDPTASGCCLHLRGIELALRAQHVPTRLFVGGVAAEARIAEELVLRQRFPLPESIILYDIPEHRDQWASQELVCKACDSVQSFEGGVAFPQPDVLTSHLQ
jgi:hypothetical protein